MAKRTILITGGTRGIGKACALRLARDGYDVVLGYARDHDAAMAAHAEVTAVGAACQIVAADLTSDAGIDELFHQALAQVGRVDAVINNAGATLHIGPLATTPVETVRKVIELNLTSAVLVARQAARVLPDDGVLINISSGAATTGSPGEYVHYAAAKAGVDALTKGLALELAPRGIRVVGIAPGVIDTDIHADAGDPDRTRRAAQSNPLRRIGTPEEVAGTVAFALSDEAAYITGTTIRIAGGV